MYLFSRLAAGNITYKMLQSFGAAEAIGLYHRPKECPCPSVGTSVREIVNMATQLR